MCLIVAGALLIPQAFVTQAWQFAVLRLLMGMALAGLMPSVNSMIRHSVPDAVAGTMLGYAVSAQFAGQVIGPVAGGFVGGHFGVRVVFFGTATVMFIAAAANWIVRRAMLRG
jgi:MFS family permease